MCAGARRAGSTGLGPSCESRPCGWRLGGGQGWEILSSLLSTRALLEASSNMKCLVLSGSLPSAPPREYHLGVLPFFVIDSKVDSLAVIVKTSSVKWACGVC